MSKLLYVCECCKNATQKKNIVSLSMESYDMLLSTKRTICKTCAENLTSLIDVRKDDPRDIDRCANVFKRDDSYDERFAPTFSAAKVPDMTPSPKKGKKSSEKPKLTNVPRKKDEATYKTGDYTEPEVTAIISMANSGASYEDMAKALNRSVRGLKVKVGVLRREGRLDEFLVSPSGKTTQDDEIHQLAGDILSMSDGVPKLNGKGKNVDRGKVKALYDAGWSVPSIAVDCALSERAVRNILGF